MDDRFEKETQERWGNTEAWRESRRRTQGYSTEEVAAIKAELEAIEGDFARLMEAGLAPDAPDAVKVAEHARLHIDRWYYPCPPTMHVALAEMYLVDPRFRAHYDDRRSGLAEFVAEAIRANAEVAEVGE